MKNLLYFNVLLAFFLWSLTACENHSANKQQNIESIDKTGEKNEINESKGHLSEFRFSNLTNIFNQHFEGKDQNNTKAYIIDNVDTLFIKRIDNLSVNKMDDSTDNRIGLWPEFMDCALTCAKNHPPANLLTIVFKKESPGKYSIWEPMKIGYYDGEYKYKNFNKITEIRFDFCDGSRFQFIRNKDGQYIFKNTFGLSSEYSKFFN